MSVVVSAGKINLQNSVDEHRRGFVNAWAATQIPLGAFEFHPIHPDLLCVEKMNVSSAAARRRNFQTYRLKGRP
jgi:hypothetical protein